MVLSYFLIVRFERGELTMAYGGQRISSTTEFGKWLDLQMRKHNLGVIDIAKKLHVGSATVVHHRTGRRCPTFPDVVAYCWVFGYKDDPEKIWELVDILI